MSSSEIDSLLHEERIIAPSDAFRKAALLQSLQDYEQMYRESISEPEKFWARQARENLFWFKDFGSSVFRGDFSSIGEREGLFVEYFSSGVINASYNCLDRHLDTWRANKAAIIWQGEREEEKRTLTYMQLYLEVCRFANVLRKHGVKRGDAVTLFLPMIPELVIAVLACARLGAVHSVVFSAFSFEALRNRIMDCSSRVVVTADVGFHGGKTIQLKEKVDKALLGCEQVRRVIVFNRGNQNVDMKSGRDCWWHVESSQDDIGDKCEAEPLPSEHPLFVLYTSGSTGKPKGVMHTTAGYLLYAHVSFKYIFDYDDKDVFWCTADVGWVTGHSYLIYGPLSNGATCMMFEGVPTYPAPDRFWKIIAQNRVSVFYTAPTALRALMRLGDELPKRHDLSSLRLLGSVGEPINPEAWMWYYRVIGNERCPIVDTWWQTETGGIMISTLPGAMSMKPGSAGKPFFGVAARVVGEDGAVVTANHGGSLVIESPWPGMIRGVYGDATNKLIKEVYFSKFPGKYFTADGCRVDEDGYYWLLGRIDDVLNVSAHRIATAEVESALVSHRAVSEAAVVGYPHETKGQGICCFVTLKSSVQPTEEVRKELIQQVRSEIGPIATPDRMYFADALPKTRSGKIMRRILKKIAAGEIDKIGDTTTLADPSVVDNLVAAVAKS
ncbi:MAG: acetate--CoA ligase [Deltaproteobacteria bacterium]|nr:acetate--CoA ligase [Deltaproteobacteria bacterium]